MAMLNNQMVMNSIPIGTPQAIQAIQVIQFGNSAQPRYGAGTNGPPAEWPGRSDRSATPGGALAERVKAYDGRVKKSWIKQGST